MGLVVKFTLTIICVGALAHCQDVLNSKAKVESVRGIKANATKETKKPAITKVTSPSEDGYYHLNDTIIIEIDFSENITVTGSPVLTLETGTTDHNAVFDSSTLNAAFFIYTVQDGDNSLDLNYQSTTSLDLDSGKIIDDNGQEADLNLPPLEGGLDLASQKNLIIDTTAPTISAIGDLSIDEGDEIGLVNFSISDNELPLTCTESVSVLSSNSALIPDQNIKILGTDLNCSADITPISDQSGSATITFTVSDGSLSATSSFVLTVGTVAESPTVSTIADQTIDEDNTTSALAFTIADGDSTLTCEDSVTGSSSDTNLVPNPNIVVAGSAPNCTVTINPSANQSGSATITLTVSDGSLSTSSQFALTVNATDDSPTISTIVDQIINEDNATNTLAFTIADIDSTLTCAGSVVGTSSATSLVPNGNIAIAGTAPNCTVTVTPSANQSSSATITLTVSDGSLSTSSQFALTVNATDDSPTISTVANQTINEDNATSALTFSIADIDSTLTCAGSVNGSSSATNLVPNVNIAIAGTAPNCTVTVTPSANQSGSATITLTVSDGSLSTSSNFSVTVNAVNDNPTVSAINDQTINEENSTDALTFTISDVDSTITCTGNVDGTSSDTTLVPNNMIIINTVSATNCTVTVAPASDHSGTATITLTVNDGTLNNQSSFLLTVTEVNDAPTISVQAPSSTTHITEGNNATISITPADIDSPSATISIYKSTSNTGCSTGLTGWTQIVSGLSLSTTSYNWDTTSATIAINNYICTAITDGQYTTYEVSTGLFIVDQKPLIDLVPGAAAAYSLRKLRSTYTGYAVRVRRSSDDTEQDIGFVGNDFDDATFTSFIGVSSGFVKTWYDQSGNSRDFIQATYTRQPQIILNVQNGKPVVRFDGSDLMRTAADISIPNQTWVLIYKRNVDNNQAVLTQSGGNYPYLQYGSTWYVGSNSGSYSMTNGTFYLRCATANNVSTTSHYSNGTLLGTLAPGNADPNSWNAYRELGSYGNGAGSFLNGDVNDIVIYGSVLSSENLSTIFADINAYYAIY